MTTVTNTVLKNEFDFYLKHQDELASQYDGKVIVLKDGKVIGSYATQLEALTETRKTHPLGSFLVQRVSKDNSGHSQTFHSRVRFA